MVLAVPSYKLIDLTSKIKDVLASRPDGFIINPAEGQSAFVAKEDYDYGQDGKGSPEFLAKWTEARRIREEASAAIEKGPTRDEYC